ncbi:hypothetical protein J6590_009538 [Homalodisca vitripennis]|nr:hypothetical protein J6590_009538 [Homalodisca vitripennis]
MVGGGCLSKVLTTPIVGCAENGYIQQKQCYKSVIESSIMVGCAENGVSLTSLGAEDGIFNSLIRVPKTPITRYEYMREPGMVGCAEDGVFLAGLDSSGLLAGVQPTLMPNRPHNAILEGAIVRRVLAFLVDDNRPNITLPLPYLFIVNVPEKKCLIEVNNYDRSTEYASDAVLSRQFPRSDRAVVSVPSPPYWLRRLVYVGGPVNERKTSSNADNNIKAAIQYRQARGRKSPHTHRRIDFCSITGRLNSPNRQANWSPYRRPADCSGRTVRLAVTMMSIRGPSCDNTCRVWRIRERIGNVAGIGGVNNQEREGEEWQRRRTPPRRAHTRGGGGSSVDINDLETDVTRLKREIWAIQRVPADGSAICEPHVGSSRNMVL